MLIDTHLHLSNSDYDNIEEVILRAKKSNVEYLIVSCCNMNDIKEGIVLLEKYDNIFLSIGLHPSEVDAYSDKDIQYIRNIFSSNNKIVAIGEIGLDYYYGRENKELQKELFIKQLNIAQDLKVPVVIHTRDAAEDTINILKKYNLKGVIHCFSGSLETAKLYIKTGYKLGIGGVSTFKNSKLNEILKSIELSDILLETDSPYLAPEPVRGTKNEPSNIKYVCQNLSAIKDTDYERVAEVTSQNAIDMFDLSRFL